MSQPRPGIQETSAPGEPRAGVGEPGDGAAPQAADAGGGEPEGVLHFLRRNRLGPAAALGVLWTFTPAVCGIMLFWKMETVSVWLRGWGDGGVAIYAGLFIVLAGLGMLPTVSQAVLGGWCFGFAAGYPAALAGFTGASLIGYIVAKTVAHGRVEQAIQTNPRARAMREALIGHGFWKTLGLVTLLRLPPNSPFALTNFAMSTTGVPVLAYVLGTMLGMAPRTAVAVMIGWNLQKMTQQLTQESIREAGHPTIMIAVSLALFVVIGWIGKRTWDRVTGPGSGAGARVGP